MKTVVLRDMTTFSLIFYHQRFGGKWCPVFRVGGSVFLRNSVTICILLRWKVDAIHSSETSMILLFYLENKGRTFLRNVCSDLPSYMTSHIGIQHSSKDFLAVFATDCIASVLLQVLSYCVHIYRATDCDGAAASEDNEKTSSQRSLVNERGAL
jgi:hypothetical protein